MRRGTPLPIVYDIDPAVRITTACLGDVKLDEVLAHFRELALRDLPERVDVLLDLSGMTSLPESGEIRAAADALAAIRSKTVWDACAVVAKQDVIFGMSRMFAVYAEQVFARMHVFRELSAAERWLAEKR